MKKLLAIFTLICLLSAISSGTSLPNYRKGAAEMGMGGATSLYGYNTSAVIYNPALLNRAKFGIDLVNLGFIADNQFTEMAKFVKDHQEEFGHFDSLSSNPDPTQRKLETQQKQAEFLNSMEKFDDQWLKLGIAPQIGVTWSHFGIVFANQTFPQAKLNRGIFNPMVALQGVSQSVLYVGYGSEKTFYLFDKDRTIEYGISGKYLNQRDVPIKWLSGTKVNSDKEMVNQVKDDFSNAKTGISFDIGGIHKLNDRVELAAVMHDAIGIFDGKYLTPNIVIGSKYDVRQQLIPEDKIVSRWVAVGEISDLLNGHGTSFFYKWHMGTEATLLKRFAFRGGFNQGYPTYGFGLDLFVLKLDYTYFGEELGTQPGQLPSYKHFAQISIGW